MTYDLLKNIIDMTDSKVNGVEICNLKDNTYYALVHLTYRDKALSVDSRPSDAIALALRSRAPIFVSEELLKKYNQIETTAESVPTDKSEQGEK